MDDIIEGKAHWWFPEAKVITHDWPDFFTKNVHWLVLGLATAVIVAYGVERSQRA